MVNAEENMANSLIAAVPLDGYAACNRQDRDKSVVKTELDMGIEAVIDMGTSCIATTTVDVKPTGIIATATTTIADIATAPVGADTASLTAIAATGNGGAVAPEASSNGGCDIGEHCVHAQVFRRPSMDSANGAVKMEGGDGAEPLDIELPARFSSGAPSKGESRADRSDNGKDNGVRARGSSKSRSPTISRSRSRTRSRSLSHSRSRSRSRSRSKLRSRSRSRRSRSSTRSKSKSRSRSRSRNRSRSTSRPRYKRNSRSSRSRSPARRRSRSNSSSSRDTYNSFKASPQRSLGEFPCRKCDRTDFESIRELSEHQIRAHGANIPCPHCDKETSSVQKLVDHLKHRHPDLRVVCDYCKEEFSSKVSSAKDSKWEDYRSHVYKECLKEKMYSHERLRGRGSSGVIAQRGRGRCPHGPPVKCKNFPKCPGVKCYYFHGYCRYDVNCVKKECPFDHTDRPRVCLSCLRDYKVFSSRDRRSSRR